MAVELRPPNSRRGGGAIELQRDAIQAALAARDERRFRLLSVVGSAAVCAYVIATVAQAPREVLSLGFVVLMAPLPFIVWWAYVRASPKLRRPLLLLAWAATLWLLGSVVWQAFYVAGGNKVPHSPGVWDAFFVAARLLVIVALVIAMRSLIRFKLAVLDSVILAAAGLALAAPFVHRGLGEGLTPAALFTLNRPLLSIATVMLIVSAALGSWEGIPRSMAMLGLAELPLTLGNLIYSYQAAQGRYVDDRWANLAWGAGAVAAMLAAAVIILGIDRQIQLPAQVRIPNHPPGSRLVTLLSLGALILSLGVACYGLLVGSRANVGVGLIAAATIGAAMASRARASIGTAEEAYVKLDRALAETERAKDKLAVANAELSRANAELRTIHIAFADLLNLADEKTHGRIRAIIEDTGGELAELLEEQIELGRRR